MEIVLFILTTITFVILEQIKFRINLVYQYSLLSTNKLTIMEYIEKTSLNFKPI